MMLKKQKGFSLLEAAVVIMIMGMAIVGFAEYQSKERLNTEKTLAGAELNSKANVINAYIAKYGSQLAGAQAIPGVANPLQPTLAELSALGFTQANGKPRFSGGDYVVELARVPSGCVPPNCNIEGIIRTSSPVKDKDGKVDLLLANSIASAAGADGASSTSDNPSKLTGPDAAWSLTNSVNTAGIVGVRVGSSSSIFASYCPKTGCSFTGQVDMAGNNITGVGAVTASTFNGNLNGNAATATQATNATNAVNATNATNATNAQTAAMATRAAVADNATQAQYAVNAGKATNSDFATNANFANTADTANTATNASNVSSISCAQITGSQADLCNITGGGSTSGGGGSTPPPRKSCSVPATNIWAQYRYASYSAITINPDATVGQAGACTGGESAPGQSPQRILTCDGATGTATTVSATGICMNRSN